MRINPNTVDVETIDTNGLNDLLVNLIKIEGNDSEKRKKKKNEFSFCLPLMIDPLSKVLFMFIRKVILCQHTNINSRSLLNNNRWWCSRPLRIKGPKETS